VKGLVLLTLVSGVHRAQWAFIMGNGKYLSASLDFKCSRISSYI
jgi:hypothetical protein